MNVDPLQQDEAVRLSRVLQTLHDMLADRGYDLSAVRWPSVADVDAAHGDREPLSMLVQHASRPSQWLFVCFPNELKVGVKPIRDVGVRMDRAHCTRAILVVRQALTPFARRALRDLINGVPSDDAPTSSGSSSSISGGGRKIVDVFCEDELLVNVTKHEDVPQHTVLTPKQKRQLLERYRCKDSQLPRMLSSDPVARYYGLRRGQVCRIERRSETGGICFFYRVVV